MSLDRFINREEIVLGNANEVKANKWTQQLDDKKILNPQSINTKTSDFSNSVRTNLYSPFFS